MNLQISSQNGYAAEARQAELDNIELHISHENTNIEQIEALIAQLKQRQEAAKELLDVAQGALDKPLRQGMPADFYVAPTRDKRTAEKVLTECAEKIASAQEALQGVKARLAQWQGFKKEFSEDSLRAKRMLEGLRRRVLGR
ncbi:MAG: hypothetical protein LAP21_24190 [Acidobacteriia bacterium]|nr:hypothetical protein [Terriglobia bacterium]